MYAEFLFKCENRWPIEDNQKDKLLTKPAVLFEMATKNIFVSFAYSFELSRFLVKSFAYGEIIYFVKFDTNASI